MRLTVVSPAVATDVEVDDGVPLARLRVGLARLTGDAGWTVGSPTVDGVHLDDAHPTGRPPLTHGATVRSGPGPVPDAVRAARAPWHLAIVAGPDTGALLVADGQATLGPGTELPVADDQRWSLVVRPEPARRRPRGRRPSRGHRRCADHGELDGVFALQVRSAGPPALRGRAAPRAVLVLPDGRSRHVPTRRWTRWRPGDEVRVGSSVVVLRQARDAPRTVARTERARVRAGLTRVLPAVAGATTSVALAVSMRQPVLLLGALSALVLLGPLGVPTPRPRGHDDPADDDPGDLPALRIALAAPVGVSAGDGRDRAPATPPPRVHGRRQPVPWDGDLTVTGPRPAALAAARALLLVELTAAEAPAVAVRTSRPADWAWLVWHRAAGAGTPLVVLDGAFDPGTPGQPRRVLRVTDRAPAAATGTVLAVDGRTARLRHVGGGWQAVPFLGVTTAVAEATVRAAGARPTALAQDDDASGRCPDDVALGALPGVPPADPRSIAARWRLGTGHARGGLVGEHPPPAGTPPAPARLATPIGSGPGGVPVVVDLVRDGPHVLVAGTTGAGKSELLTSLVLGLALAHPPDRLSVLLVDFKGGTGLPALARLPHVVGHLSDLDAAGARRTLRGLSAELHRRERVLGSRAARDLRDLDPTDPRTPPRLLVVVDEFRVLADELPDLLPGLARIAAQGRSLGVHLVLATQRPAGAVPADLRANVALRIVLRVADPADSTDLVGVPDAAGFTRPGQALLVRGGGRPQPFQVARATARRAHPVRLAGPVPDDVPTSCPAWTPPAPTTDGPAATAVAVHRSVAPHDDGPAPWVGAVRAAAAGCPQAAEPWLAPLPDLVTTADVPPGPGLPIALADLPDVLSRGPVRWDPDAGHLLVLGGPGSGRTTALLAAGSAAVAQGRAVHVVGVPARLVPPGVASVLDAQDVTRVARLVRLLADTRDRDDPRPVLLLDDVATVLAGLVPLARGAAADRLEQLWASAGSPVAVLATGGAGPATARLTPFFADRLVLGSPDPTGDMLAGVPPEMAGPRPVPGRAVHVTARGAALCQVALAEPAGPPPTAGSGCRTGPRVHPLPRRVAAADLPAPVRASPTSPTGGPLVPIGLGGDDAGPVAVDLSRPLLVVGPPGSGRTAALQALASGAAAAGLRVVRLAPGCAPTPGTTDPDAILVVDDLDELEAQEPTTADALGARLMSGAAPRLLAATTTAHAVSAFRGPVPALVRARRLLVLDLAEPGALDLLGSDAGWLADPRHHPPGRGVLRLGRDLVPVQVVAPA